MPKCSYILIARDLYFWCFARNEIVLSQRHGISRNLLLVSYFTRKVFCYKPYRWIIWLVESDKIFAKWWKLKPKIKTDLNLWPTKYQPKNRTFSNFWNFYNLYLHIDAKNKFLFFCFYWNDKFKVSWYSPMET